MIGWENAESLVEQSKIQDLNKDSAKQFIENFYKFLGKHNILEHYYKKRWEPKEKTVEELITFERIMEENDNIGMVFRSDSKTEWILYLPYDSFSRFSFLKKEWPRDGKGVYVSRCFSKNRWGGDVDPSQRVDHILLIPDLHLPCFFR